MKVDTRVILLIIDTVYLKNKCIESFSLSRKYIMISCFAVYSSFFTDFREL